MLRKTVWIALLLLPGCQELGGILDSMDKPSVRVADVALTDLSLDAVTLAIDLPYSKKGETTSSR